jgi:hypothetical protein
LICGGVSHRAQGRGFYGLCAACPSISRPMFV